MLDVTRIAIEFVAAVSGIATWHLIAWAIRRVRRRGLKYWRLNVGGKTLMIATEASTADTEKVVNDVLHRMQNGVEEITRHEYEKGAKCST